MQVSEHTQVSTCQEHSVRVGHVMVGHVRVGQVTVGRVMVGQSAH